MPAHLYGALPMFVGMVATGETQNSDQSDRVVTVRTIPAPGSPELSAGAMALQADKARCAWLLSLHQPILQRLRHVVGLHAG